MTAVSDIEAALFRAAEALSDIGFSHIVIGNGLLAILILKYVSDTARDESAQNRARFVVPASANLYQLGNQRDGRGVAQQLDTALRDIEAANPHKLGGLFDDVHFGLWTHNDVDDKGLEKVLQIFQNERFDLRPSRAELSESVGLLLALRAFGTPEQVGEFYTPWQISRLIIGLVAPQSGNSIYDPACGSAGFLLEAARYINEHHHSHDYALYGQAMNRTAWQVARMNALLHGEDEARIELGDTLRNPQLLNGAKLQQFDVVVSNPPFSVPDWGWEEARADPFNRFGPHLPPKARADYAFILHSIASTKAPDGRMAIIVPQGVLFRGASEAAIRRDLIERNLLDAVIGLPPKLFYHSAIAAVILVFRRSRATDEILFIDASREFEPGRKLNSLSEAGIQKLVFAARHRSAEPGYSRRVPRGEVAANDYNLNISLYVSKSEPQPAINMNQLAREAEELGAELVTLRRQIDETLEKLRSLG